MGSSTDETQAPGAEGAASTLRPGATVDRYVLERELGAGGMGRVYLAHDPKLGRRVALKVVLAEAGDSVDDQAQWSTRLVREARAAASLKHQHAVVVYDVGECDGKPFIAMEYVEGRALRAYVGDTSTPWPVKLRWLCQVARALGAAHAAGIVHRDVKPDNVIIGTNGEAKVVDFGIARRPSIEASEGPTAQAGIETLTAKGQMIGTPRYMAPEQILSAEVDGRTDQFSWGVMAYEVLAGTIPWSGDHLKVVAEILTSAPRGLRTFCADVPEAVEALVRRAMDKAPEARFGSMEEIADALEPIARAGLDSASGGVTASGTSAICVAEKITSARTADEPMNADGERRPVWHGMALALGVLAIAGVTTALVTKLSSAPTDETISPPLVLASPDAGTTRVAVLPFTNLTKKSEDDWLRLGLSEAIGTKLGGVRGVEIVAAHGLGADAAEAEKAAKGLAVSILVTGEFQRVGDEVRVTLRAHEPGGTGAALLAMNERGPISKVFDLQDSLALALADKLRGTLPVEAREQVRQRGTRNLEAFESYARGLVLIEQGKVGEAMHALDRAIDLDPAFRAARSVVERTRADSNHVELRADGVAVQTVLLEQSTEETSYGFTTNARILRKAWDLEGNPLAIRAEKRGGDETTFTLTRPKGEKGPSSFKSFVYEATLPRGYTVAAGMGLADVETSWSYGGERTYLVQLPPKATILSVSPIPIESSESATGVFLLFRMSAEPWEYTRWRVLFAFEASAAEKFWALSVPERTRWLVAEKLCKKDKQASRLARGAEPLLVCKLARQGRTDEAQVLMDRIMRASGDHGPFLVARAKACMASAKGDAARALEELRAAATAKDRSDDVVQGVYLELIDLCAGRCAPAELLRIVRKEHERYAWWESGMFHRGATGPALERMLVEAHARTPQNDAVRHDLAMLHLAAGRLDDAQRMLEGRENSTSRAYVLDLQAQIAEKRGDPKGIEEAARNLAMSYPMAWAWRNHASTLAEAGRAIDALDFLLAKATPKTVDPPDVQILDLIVPLLEHPVDQVPRLLQLLGDVPRENMGYAFRVDSLARLVAALDTSRSEERESARGIVFQRMKQEATQLDPKRCPAACRQLTARRICASPSTSPDLRQWLARFRGAPCTPRK